MKIVTGKKVIDKNIKTLIKNFNENEMMEAQGYYLGSNLNSRGSTQNGPLRHNLFPIYYNNGKKEYLTEINVPLDYEKGITSIRGRISKDSNNFYLLRSPLGMTTSGRINITEQIKKALADRIIKIDNKLWIIVCCINDFKASDVISVLAAIKTCRDEIEQKTTSSAYFKTPEDLLQFFKATFQIEHEFFGTKTGIYKYIGTSNYKGTGKYKHLSGKDVILLESTTGSYGSIKIFPEILQIVLNEYQRNNKIFSAGVNDGFDLIMKKTRSSNRFPSLHQVESHYVSIVRSIADRLQDFKNNQESDPVKGELKLAEVLVRKNQQTFKRELLKAYSNICMVTGSEIKQIIEAAHIIPFSEEQDHSIDNGLLLRSDIHKLFDKDLMGIHPEKLTVHFVNEAFEEYKEYHGKPIQINGSRSPNLVKLKIKWKEFLQNCDADEYPTWMGEVPQDCPLCKKKLKNVFYDARLKGQTSWSLMCKNCFSERGMGLGSEYDLITSEKLNSFPPS